MFLLIKTNARILDLRPVSDFPPCSSGRIPIQGDDKEHLDKHVGFDRWKCDIIHMGLLQSLSAGTLSPCSGLRNIVYCIEMNVS